MNARKLTVRGPLIVLALLPHVVCGPAGESAPSAPTQTAQAIEREPVDLLVLGGTVVTMDAERRVLPYGGVALSDGEIKAIGAAGEIASLYEGREVIRPSDHDIVMPGLINGHNHAAMTLLRGVADDLRLMEWLESYIFPAEAALVDEEFVRVGTELAALEMIRSGTTTFADMYYFEDQVAWAVRDAGLRGVLGETILDFPSPDSASVDEALAYTEEFLQNWVDHPRVIAAVAPHAAFTASPDTLRRAAELARRYGAPILIHLSETRDENAQVREQYGLSPTQHLERLGVLGPDVLGAHSIWVDAADIATLAERGVGVVHNPESNMKLASGTMPVAELRAAGVAVGLGTDGAASNNDLDMFEAIFTAALLHKHAAGDPTALPAAEAVAMATIEGARALGLDDRIGSLEAGKRADLIIVDGSGANQVPRYDVYSLLTYTASGADVRLTMVDGRILYRDGEFTHLDEAAIVAAARGLAARVREVVGARQ